MVSVRYLREQREDEERKRRLLAARHAAANASVRNARMYAVLKEQQLLAVRADMEAQWHAETLQRQTVVERLLEEGLAKRGQGMRSAATVREEEQRAAEQAAAAWAAEASREEARHRLAVAAQRVSRQQADGGRAELVERKRVVRALERMRAAQVAAAPPAPSYEEVRAELAPAYPAEERRALTRANAAFSMSRRDIGSADCGRIAAGALARPLVDLAAHGQESRLPKEDPQEAVMAVEEYTQRRAAERDALVRRQRAESTRRASEALRAQRAQREADEKEAAARLERQRAAADSYRRPPPEDEGEEEGKDGNGQSGGSNALTVNGMKKEQSPLHRVSAKLHPVTYRQQVALAARQAEEAFAQVFLHGPPVLLHQEVERPACAPRSLEELLRPAKLADLLPSDGENERDTDHEDSSEGEGDGYADSAPVAALVRPSRFQTNLVVVDIDDEGFTSNGEGEKSVLADGPQVAVEVSGHDHGDSEFGNAKDNRGVEAPVPTARPMLNVGSLSRQPTRPTSAITSGVNTESPTPTPDPPMRGAEGPTEDPAAPTAETVYPHQPVPIVYSADATSPPAPAEDTSRVTTQTSVSLSTSGSSDTEALGQRRGTTRGGHTTLSSSSSSRSASQTGSSLNSTTLTDSTITSSTGSHPYPTMTAEQLRLALVRLRHRMRTVQL